MPDARLKWQRVPLPLQAFPLRERRRPVFAFRSWLGLLCRERRQNRQRRALREWEQLALLLASG